MMYRVIYRYGTEASVIWSFDSRVEAERHADYHRKHGAWVSRIYWE